MAAWSDRLADMKGSKARLAPRQKRSLYIVSGILWFSGAIWLYLRYFGQLSGEYGPESNPAQPLWLKVHGAAAMAFLIVFGTLLGHHVPLGWRQKSQRPSGGILIGLCGVLILTGWGLYYLGNERLRHWTSLTHCILGIASPLVLIVHIRLAARPK